MVVFLNGRGWRVRVAQAATWIGFAVVLWVVFGLPPNPNDGPADRWVGIGGAMLMGLAVVGLEYYLRLYAICMEIRGDELVVTSLATLHHKTRRLPLAQLSLGQIRRDRDETFGIDNRWAGLSSGGRNVPMLLDLTAPEIFDRGVLAAAIKAARAVARRVE